MSLDQGELWRSEDHCNYCGINLTRKVSINTFGLNRLYCSSDHKARGEYVDLKRKEDAVRHNFNGA